jgi:dihydrolipoamide dehydrogenase
MSPDIVDGQVIVTSKEVWKLRDRPEKVVIIGAGPIGVEFATVYHSYGAEVTLVEMLPRLVPLEDAEISATLTREFKKRKINILTETKVVKVEKTADGKKAIVELVDSKGANPQTLEVDRVLLGIGFAPNSENLGLEKLGIKVERGFIQINDQMQTNVPGVWAIGDVTGKLPLRMSLRQWAW